jgi:hypothetical protein
MPRYEVTVKLRPIIQAENTTAATPEEATLAVLANIRVI